MAEETGLSRQRVHRVADLLVARGIAEYRQSPSRARPAAAATPERRRAIAAPADSQDRWANRTSARLDEGELRRVLHCIERISEILAADEQ